MITDPLSTESGWEGFFLFPVVFADYFLRISQVS